MTRCPHTPRWVPPLLAAGAVVLAAGTARASLTIDHESGAGGCADASTYFPEDESPEATRARRRCRLEIFERKMEKDRLQREVELGAQRDRLIEKWMQKQEIPVRVMRRNSIDGYLSGGLTSYGLAIGGVLFPWLEGELWLGRRNVAASTSNNTGYFQDSRTCGGGRFKWLMRLHGDLTPFASVGVAGCAANVALSVYNYTSAPTGAGQVFTGNTNSEGTASAHAVTGSAGAAWMHGSGLRISLEYVFAYAFYSQTTLNDAAKTEDPNLRAAWDDRLASDRGGIRAQVGYAF